MGGRENYLQAAQVALNALLTAGRKGNRCIEHSTGHQEFESGAQESAYWPAGGAQSQPCPMDLLCYCTPLQWPAHKQR